MTVASVIAYKDGILQVQFSEGASVTVRPDPTYEAWELAGGSGGPILVCLPGSGLGVWQHGDAP